MNVAETDTGTSAINDTEEIFKNELSSLYESIEKFISTEIPIEGVLSYAYLSEEEWDVTCNITPEMANLEETIEIPDQKLVMKHLKTVLESFKGHIAINTVLLFNKFFLFIFVLELHCVLSPDYDCYVTCIVIKTMQQNK